MRTIRMQLLFRIPRRISFFSINLLSQWELIQVASPEKNQLRQSRATQPYLITSLVYAGSVLRDHINRL